VSFLVPAGDAGGARFRVLGFDTKVEWAFFVIMPLLGLALGDPLLILAWVAIAGVSILVHELGHAMAFRTFGLDARIVLHGFGGVTYADGELAERWRRVTVSLAGPFTGLLLFGLPALVVLRSADSGTTAADLAWLVVWVNVGWSVLNLLPILPLDGGHVAREALLAAWPSRGEVASRVLSVAVAGGLALLAFSAGAIFLGALAAWLGYDSVRALQGRREEAGLDTLRTAAVALGQGDAARARTLAAGVATGRGGDRLRPLARELEAWAALTVGDEAGARAAVATVPSGGSGHLQALLVETDPAERLNRTADAWLHGGPMPPAVYV
jgi:Zn-dependent protease